MSLLDTHGSGVRPSVVRRLSSVIRPFTFSNVFFSKTARPIKAKLYEEPPWKGGKKAYINCHGHMTKMAAMPIYGKTLKNLLLQNQSPMILKLGMYYWGLKFYKFYINEDPGLTLTYFTTRSNWVSCTFEWGKLL